MEKINVRNKSNWKGKGFYVGRPSPLSNPFIITDTQSRDFCIKSYSHMIKNSILNSDFNIISALSNLYSYLIKYGELNLICYCSPKPCHAEIIKKILLNKYHTNYWLVKNEKGEYII